MSESTIRRFVRTAFEEQGVDMGLFSDERIRSFFAVVKTLVHDCFYSLYDTVMRDYSDAGERQQRLNRGLAYIASDINHTLGADEVTRAMEEFPTVQQEYERAMARFAQFMVPQRDTGMKVEIPPFATFLMKLYRRVAISADVRSGRFFGMTYFEKDIFLKDMFRVTMNSCMSLRPSAPSLVSALSGPGGGSKSESTLVNNALMHATAPLTSPSVSTTSKFSRTSSKVLPSDSVSNIHAGDAHNALTSKQHKSKQQYDAVEEGSEDDTVSDVTQFSLRKYKKQLEERQRDKPKPFVTPSIARTNQAREQKNVNMETKSVSGFFASDNQQSDAGAAASDFAGFSTLYQQ